VQFRAGQSLPPRRSVLAHRRLDRADRFPLYRIEVDSRKLAGIAISSSVSR
jgi:hypothetical protein